jgi:hypothetical protein
MPEASIAGNQQGNFSPPSVFDMMGVPGSSLQSSGHDTASTERHSRNPVSILNHFF